MLCRLATSTSRRPTAVLACVPATGVWQQSPSSSSSLPVRGGRCPPSGCRKGNDSFSRANDISASGVATPAVATGVSVPLPRTRRLFSSSAPATAVAEEASQGATTVPKLVFGIPSDEKVLRTPPMEEEDSGPVIREMRVQLRKNSEQGSRGSRKVRREGKVPGVVYSSNDMGARDREVLLVKVDKIVLDREIRRLSTSFDNTVYELVVTGAEASPAAEQSDTSPGGGEAGGEQVVTEGARCFNPGQNHRELVIANQTRLHPVFRTLLSVNWIRYKAGRKYPIPIKFINHDLNDIFRKGAYIHRIKTHQDIVLPEDPEKVPKWLYLDLEHVDSGTKLRVGDILMPEGVRIHRGASSSTWNELVCTIKGKKVFAAETGGDKEEGA